MIFGIQSYAQSTYQLMLKGLYKNSVPTMETAELREKLLNNESLVLLDSREQDEFEVSHISGALPVGYEQFDIKSLDNTPKDASIIVYCSVGYRSERIGEKLKEAGFENVYNLYGGVFQWTNDGFELVDQDGKPTNKIHAYSKTWGLWLKKGEKVY